MDTPKKVVVCPNSSCGRKFALTPYSGWPKVRCRKCGTYVDSPFTKEEIPDDAAKPVPRETTVAASGTCGDLSPGRSHVQGASIESGNLLWDYSAKAPEDAETFLQSLRGCLPGIFRAVGNRGRDPVVMLVDVEDIRWQGLLGLLHTRHGPLYFSPETATGAQGSIDHTPDGPFYRPTTIDGKQLRVGVYALEREWLVSELCWIRGLPLPFLKQVQRATTPKGMFTIVYFLKTHLGVRHVSADLSVCEAPHLSLADLM